MKATARSSDQKHHRDVVTTVFPGSVSLFQYCTSIIEKNQQSIVLIQPDDKDSYKDLLNNSLIVPPVDNEFKFSYNGTDTFPIHDIVGRLISQLVRNGQPYHEQNCLTLGYKLKNTSSDATMRSNNDTEVYFVNTVQALISTQTWQLLGYRIGEELLRHVLKQPVFVKSDNSCYVQVSGTSVSELVFKASKKQKIDDVTQNKRNILLKACFKQRSSKSVLCKSSQFPNLNTSKDAAFRALLAQEKKRSIVLVSHSHAIARFKIFYSAQYVKRIGLSAKHVFSKNNTSCAAVVTSTYLPALSLFSSERTAIATKDRLVLLLDTIKAAYGACPLPALMERHCSVESLSTHAEPLVKEAEEPDASVLFMTPASRTSMQACQDLDDSERKAVGTSESTDTRSTGIRSRTSTWHSTASSMKMTLTNSTEKKLTASSSDPLTATSAGFSSVKSAVDPLSSEPNRSAEPDHAAPNRKKRKRGCRAGALVKQRKLLSEDTGAHGKVGNRNKNGTGISIPTQNNAIGQGSRTIAQEIHSNIEQLWKQHAQRELVTVGEKLVDNVIQNVRSDARVHELGINTQGSVRSAQSLSSVPKANKSNEASETREPELHPLTAQGESETTYASVPSVVHRPSTDKKRKFVSIQESVDDLELLGRSFGSSQQAQPEFEYFVGSGTPSVSGRALTQSTGERSAHRPFSQLPVSALKTNNSSSDTPGLGSLSGTGGSALNTSGFSISCPAQLGSITLRDCSRAKRKKIKFKFRAFFKKKLVGGAPSTPAAAVQCSPILPDSVESGLLHHLSRPFLTEAQSRRDPRTKLFPEGDSPASVRTSSHTPSRKPFEKHHRLRRARRLDALIEKSDLLSLCTPTAAVAAFIKSVCRKVFSVDTVWGTRRNLHAFLATVDSYVRLGRQETLTLALVCNGIQLSRIPWLKAETVTAAEIKNETVPAMDTATECTEEATLCSASIDHMEMEIDGTQCSEMQSTGPQDSQDPQHQEDMTKHSPQDDCTNRARASVSRADSLARMQVFYRFMDWVYGEFINPLLAACFYATEVEGRGAEVLYYRKPVWARIVQRGKQQLCNNFIPLVCTEEAHLSTQGGSVSSPTKTPRPPSSTGNLAEQLESAASLQRTASAPATHESHLQRSATAPPLQSNFNRANSGSMLFNQVLREQQYPMSSLAAENNERIAKLPPPRAGTTINRIPLQSSRLKSFLQRLPVVRFVPKKSSVRAITNLRTKRQSGSTLPYTTSQTFTTRNGQQIGEVLTNSALYNCLHVLKSVYSNNPALIGFGAFGLDDIYLKLLKYKRNIAERASPDTKEAASSADKEKSETTQPFFVAVLDLEKCYDNVDPQRLYDLLKRVLSNTDEPGPFRTHSSPLPATSRTQGGSSMSATKKTKESTTLKAENVIHKFSVTHPIKSMDRNVTKNVRYVASGGAIVPFAQSSKAVAKCYPYSIVTDAVVYPKVSNLEVLRLLKVHLFQHAVKIPVRSKAGEGTIMGGTEVAHQYFTQIKGIPQGSVLSPILCTMYYGNAERNIFGSRESIELIGLMDKTMVIRLMDDYIVVSTEQACVQHFLQAAHQSLKAYGAGVNPLKTRTNFDATVEVDGACIALQRVDGEEMPWCGLIVNTRTLEVTCHFSRLLDRPIASSVLTEYTHSGTALRRAIKSFMRMKCHAIVLDAQINSKRTVVQTLYTMYLIVALRTHAYICHLRHVLHRVRNDRYVFSSIVEGVMFGARLINTRTARKSLRKLVMGSAAHAQKFSYLSCDGDDPGIGSSENDFDLFSECVESLDPDSFGHCAVSLQEAIWLGLQAFITVLNRRRGQFAPIVRSLVARQKASASVALRRLQRIEHSAQLLQDCESVLDSAQWL